MSNISFDLWSTFEMVGNDCLEFFDQSALILCMVHMSCQLNYFYVYSYVCSYIQLQRVFPEGEQIIRGPAATITKGSCHYVEGKICYYMEPIKVNR